MQDPLSLTFYRIFASPPPNILFSFFSRVLFAYWFFSLKPFNAPFALLRTYLSLRLRLISPFSPGAFFRSILHQSVYVPLPRRDCPCPIPFRQYKFRPSVLFPDVLSKSDFDAVEKRFIFSRRPFDPFAKSQKPFLSVSLRESVRGDCFPIAFYQSLFSETLYSHLTASGRLTPDFLLPPPSISKTRFSSMRAPCARFFFGRCVS